MVKLGYLVIVAQWLEFQIVDLAVAGSNPVDHPKKSSFGQVYQTIALQDWIRTLSIGIGNQEGFPSLIKRHYFLS